MDNIGMIIVLLIIIAAIVGIITGIYAKVQENFVEPVKKAKLDNKIASFSKPPSKYLLVVIS